VDHPCITILHAGQCAPVRASLLHTYGDAMDKRHRSLASCLHHALDWSFRNTDSLERSTSRTMCGAYGHRPLGIDL